jgi:hypothetical protein
MSDNDGGCAIASIAIILIIVGPVWAYSFGCDAGEQIMLDKAVTDGVAEYYLDENNVRQWRWKAER